MCNTVNNIKQSTKYINIYSENNSRCNLHSTRTFTF